MPPRAATAAAAAPPAPEDRNTALKKQLYEACIEYADDEYDAVFFQDTLFELGILPEDDVSVLLAVTQALTNEKLFKVVQDPLRGLGWRIRSVEDAKKYRGLTSEQEIVYSLIDEAGEEGLWSKSIKAKANLHEAVFSAAIKHLLTKHFVSEMKSVEYIGRRLYIKSSLQPSERASGGAWYTDHELDEEFISQLMHLLYDQIRRKSFYKSSSATLRKPKKVIGKKMSTEEAKALRDKTLGPRVKLEDISEEDALQAARRNYDSMLPMPPGYQGYPTLAELTSFIENSGATSATLTSDDIQQLLDILVFDNKIEKVLAGPDGVCYKAIRKGFREDRDGGPNSALTDAPCGYCPVADLCEDGGPVGPTDCNYFQAWLNP